MNNIKHLKGQRNFLRRYDKWIYSYKNLNASLKLCNIIIRLKSLSK